MCKRRGTDKRPQCSLILLVIGAIVVLLVVAILFIPNWDFLQKSKRYDYCSITLCGRKKHHIACKNDGKFGENCTETVEVVPLTDELQTFIVDKYNKIRKEAAEGNCEGPESPNRMIEMTWNSEFAQLAEYTAKTCEYKHDDCRNTEKFRNVGQNIAIYEKTSTAAIKYKEVIEMIIDEWIKEENVDITMQRVRASCSQVGCAAVHFLEKDTKNTKKFKQNVFVVCNYSSNELNKPCKICSMSGRM